MVTIGIIIFAGASALCGAVPDGEPGGDLDDHLPGAAGLWRRTHVPGGAGDRRADVPVAGAGQGARGVLRHRRRPHCGRSRILGGVLTQWTWRAIFWVNIPVAIIALVLIFISKPVTRYQAREDGLPRFGADRRRCRPERLRLSAVVDLGLAPTRASPSLHRRRRTRLLIVFFRFEESPTQASPLIKTSLFRIRAFLVENIVLGISMLAFVPIFFFASEYAQISLGKTPTNASLFLLYFFIGFVVAAQIGGRMLDAGQVRSGLWCSAASWRRSASILWSTKVVDLRYGGQQTWYVILAGAGIGFMLGPASTDAVSRAPSLEWYGMATGITPTIRKLLLEPRPCHPGNAAGLATAQPGDVLADLAGRARGPGRPGGRRHLAVPGRKQPGAPRRSRTSSGSISPPPHAPCSTPWRSSWRWPRSWPWPACAAGGRSNPETRHAPPR